VTLNSTGSRAASVRQRLLNLAKNRGEEFQRILTRYALERLLYRLSVSEERDRFLLKGALLFAVWIPQDNRPTKDLDLLGCGDPSRATLEAVFRDLCLIDGSDDGIVYIEETVECVEIREETEYGGMRITLTASLGTAEIPVQVDVGFGDAITPAPEEVEFPTLLEMPAPRLRAYPKETVVAEKCEAMVSLGMGNSRMKDFFDLWTLAQTFPFEGVVLSQALRATFARRVTPLPEGRPVALSEEFSADTAKLAQWKAFCRRSVLRGTVPSLSEVINLLEQFILPIITDWRAGQDYGAHWLPGEGWR
jgi:predicted nucleotidyltransferase component of viral defense system